MANTPITKRELPVLDQLVSQYAAQLQPEDWEVVGLPTGKPGVPPAGAAACLGQPLTYRTGYGFQLREAIASARSLSTAGAQLPRCQRNRSTTVGKYGKDKRCLIYLDQVISRFQPGGRSVGRKGGNFDTSRVEVSCLSA